MLKSFNPVSISRRFNINMQAAHHYRTQHQHHLSALSSKLSPSSLPPLTPRPGSRDVWTTINYNKSINDEAPYMYTYDPPTGVLKTNIIDDPRPVLVRDIRGFEAAKTLDNAGFQFLPRGTAPSTMREEDFEDESVIRRVYYRECEELVKKYTGAKRTFVFDHTVRRGEGGKPGIRGPAKRVHVDQSYDAAVGRVHLHLPPNDVPRLLSSRVRIVNVWRPIGHPVAHWPLGCCDFSSINPSTDLVFTRHIYPNREGSNWGVNWAEGHEWFYMSDQRPEEVILVKCYDSDEGVARCTPHTAFEDRGSPAGAPKRQSIEVRVLVFDAE